MIKSTSLVLGTVVLATSLGCSNVREQERSQTISQDGKTAQRTRTQVRETPGGATVKETEVQTREVLTTPTTNPDARRTDPAR
ncbi:MAG TPA: hypothetical protein VF595_08535 [Tepidisphaeraceae bacterium]|jgi:uncharacterized lipoprotein